MTKRDQFIEACAEIIQLERQRDAIEEKIKARTALRDSIWPADAPMPTVGSHAKRAPANGKRKAASGATSGEAVYAFMEKHPGQPLSARQVTEGMKLDTAKYAAAIRASLNRLADADRVKKSDDARYSLA